MWCVLSVIVRRALPSSGCGAMGGGIISVEYRVFCFLITVINLGLFNDIKCKQLYIIVF